MRLRLVEAAGAVLRKKGYAGLRTDEVARVAKVSRGALQHHFPSKDSLVLATAEHLLRGSLARGQRRAATVEQGIEPIDALIADGIDFFLGPDFGVILDLVLAGSKSRGLRDRILAQARENRLGVEDVWLNVLAERGVPRVKAEKLVQLTVGIVRGLAVRALWQNDPELFKSLLDEWKLIVAGHLKSLQATA
jgi:AcrR family transcriptional regulator